ncbi:MAG: amidohydrolase, partial [Candidatus Krumholzibacteriota bacterium]|nr:amidohydrolase [Candidatus Krumholzibacteriota bacterium]
MKKISIVLACAVSLLSPSFARAAEVKADLIVTGAVYTLDPRRPRVEAVAAAEGRIVYAGNREGAGAFQGPETRVIDAAGLAVFPGLVDAHA